MSSIVERKRKNGPPVFDAQIVIKRMGRIVHRESQTFDRRPAANGWLIRRETELGKPGALERGEDPPLKVAIDRYVEASTRDLGRTKEQCLNTIKESELGEMRCSYIGSKELVAFASELDVQPQTRGNYMSHLGSVFSVARPAWNYALDRRAFEDAMIVLKKLGVVSRSRERKRRPTLDELDKVMLHYDGRVKVDYRSPQMQKVIAFAIFSTRRQEEITRILWDDLDPVHSRIMVRDMKNPGEKIGNDVWCDLPPEALAIIQSMPKADKQIFPYNPTTIGESFQRACILRGVNAEEMPDEERLKFHDLRHEGVSRLFEIGYDIPRASTVSGHRDWKSLKRYTHIRQTGDKYQNWKWLPVILGAATTTA
jgi:integrase